MSDIVETIKSSNLHKWLRVAAIAVTILVGSVIVRSGDNGTEVHIDWPQVIREIADELDEQKKPQINIDDLGPPIPGEKEAAPACGCNKGKGCCCGDDCGCSEGCECGDDCMCDPCECGKAAGEATEGNADVTDIDIPQPQPPTRAEFEELEASVASLVENDEAVLAQVSSLQTQLDSLQAQITSLDKECERIDGRADALSLRYNAAREAILEQREVLRGLQLTPSPQPQTRPIQLQSNRTPTPARPAIRTTTSTQQRRVVRHSAEQCR